ncbi:Deoxyribose-phosphate aldolase [Mucinivorans hirudinis]|uniref:Deoxyribose-phosphate aldolase n=1 Tax=Mucinivorans hirudinis TaxID=1433126 RepID=A0A060R7L7_9BACT|nr:Deoxyribose-phosphate aldolase [Mucinivorans hirudinis]
MKNLNSFLDYTSLNQSDTPQTITDFTNRIVEAKPAVAAVCVYSAMVEAAGNALVDTNIAIAAVCGGFPAPQTFVEVKMLEVAMAVENGADEIDIVANIGAMLDGDFDLAQSEVEIIAAEIDGDALLKVIIESGVLKDENLIYRASMCAMRGGADFVKSSTGKCGDGATPEAVRTICCAIKDFYYETGKRVGIKVSGGISTREQAESYYDIVEEVLGKEWLEPEFFRIGTSRLPL